MNEASPAPGSVPLNGWKEIAGYLGRSVRAVQRYERELGLPVHRLRTADGQTVYAFREEIDRWRQGLDQPHGPDQENAPHEPGEDQQDAEPVPAVVTPAPRPAGPVRDRRIWIGLSALLVLVAVAGFALRNQLGIEATQPFEVRYLGDRVEALDASGRVLWSREFEREMGALPYSNLAATIIDLDGDGDVEVLVPVRFGPDRSKVTTTDAVRAFSHDGRPLWTATPDVTIVCGGQSFTGPWDLRAMTTATHEGGKMLWLAYVHHTWWPSFVFEVRPDGQAVVRYVQAGWITAVTEWPTPAGRLLAAGGVLNERGLASVALVDPSGPPAASPAATERYRCSQDSTSVHRLMLFPRLETTLSINEPYDLVAEVRVVGPDLRVNHEDNMAFARLTPDFRVAEYALTDSFFTWHQKRTQEGHVDHPAEHCPFVDAESHVFEWSSAAGWQTLNVRTTSSR